MTRPGEPETRRARARRAAGGQAGEAAQAGGRRIAWNIIAQLFVRAIQTGVSLVTISILARALDPDGFGVWSTALAYTGIFAAVTEAGLAAAAIQRMADDPEREPAWLGALVGLRVLLALVAGGICLASLPLVFAGSGEAREATAILTLNVLITASQALTSVFQSRLRGSLPLAIALIQNLLWVTGVAILASSGAEVSAFAWVFVAAAAVTAAVQLAVTVRFASIDWRAGRRLWRPLVRVGLPIGISSVFVLIYYRVDQVLLFGLASEEEAGIYGAAYRFLDPLTLVPAAIMTSFFPVLSAVRESDPARVPRLVQACADTMVAISLPALALSLALADQLVDLLYGPGFERAAGVLPILMIAFVSIGFGFLAGFLAPVLDLQWRLAGYSAVGALANVALNLVLIPPYGAFGSAWATVVTEVMTMSLLLATGLRRLGLRLSLRRMWRIALAAALCGLAMWAGRGLGLLPALVAGGAAYVAALVVLRAVSVAELKAGLRRA